MQKQCENSAEGVQWDRRVKEKAPEPATKPVSEASRIERSHMTPVEISIREVRPDRIRNPEAQDPELVRCFRHEGVECPRCDGSGLRPRKRCAGCGVPAGRPSQGGMVLSAGRGAKSWKELKALPLYCMDCNPRFLRTGLALLEGTGG